MIAAILAIALAQAMAPEARPLLPNAVIRGSLAGGESVVFSLNVPPDQAARILVRQEGVDVSVTLLANSDYQTDKNLAEGVVASMEAIGIRVIVDLVSGKITILDNRRKEYSASTLDELRAFTDQMDAAMAGRPIVDGTVGATSSVTVEKGTGGKKVAGYDTELYILTMGDSMRMEVFVTTALEPPARYFDARKALYASLGPMARRFDRMYDEMKKIKGFPLATSLDYRMRVARRQVSTEATEVRKGPIPDSVFVAPSDYKKIDSPFGGDRPPRPRPSP